jgi:arginase
MQNFVAIHHFCCNDQNSIYTLHRNENSKRPNVLSRRKIAVVTATGRYIVSKIGSISVLGVPTSAAAHSGGQERAPEALRDARLLTLLCASGLDVVDLGNTALWRWQPDRRNPRAQNVNRTVAAIVEVIDLVKEIRQAGRFALVLGGDCTIELGVIAGLQSAGALLGLLYFDMHADMNVPTSVPGGALDWMGIGHLLDCPDAEPNLAKMATMGPQDVVIFGHRLDQATAFEKAQMERLQISRVSIEEVESHPEQSVAKCLAMFPKQIDAIAVHFDVDVIDFTDAPLSEHTGRNIGLPLDTAMTALRIILCDPRVASLTISQLNPEHGEAEGATVKRFAEKLAEGLIYALRTPRA